uniref:Placenta-specific gene 8 protein-like n=1 Tax=Fundulus heteroclitus TaxID=8078 RepID=A0A3Q2UMZ9_FUNHE
MRNSLIVQQWGISDWDSGLCDCFEDASTCCYGFWCSICLAGTVSRRFGESNLLPLCDTCCFWGGVPPAALSMRAAMRHKYKIKGSLCNDIVISWCCHGLSWCQMHRELKHRKKDPVVINKNTIIKSQLKFSDQFQKMTL